MLSCPKTRQTVVSPFLYNEAFGLLSNFGVECYKHGRHEISLTVQWLQLHSQCRGAWVRSLVRELRSCILHSTAKKKKQNKTPSVAGIVIEQLHFSESLASFIFISPYLIGPAQV